MVRAAFCDQHGTRKGAWSKEEDDKLRSYVETYGHFNWRKLPKSAGLARCGKSCRLRWMNYLRPDLERGNFTQEEEETIIKLHEQHGNKWSLIAEKLPGRTDNGIKNYWHSHIKKRLKRNEMKSEFKVDTSEAETVHFTESENLRCAVSYGILESSLPMSPETSNAKDISFHNSNHAQIQSTMNLSREESPNSGLTFEEFSSTFWTEPFMVENTYNQAYNPISTHGEDSQPYFSFSYDDDTELLYQVMQDQFPKY